MVDHEKTKLILDVDTGTDDAVAIMMAALHPMLQLVACTVVNGNASVDTCTENTLRVLSHIGRSDVPVFRGAHEPLARTNFPVARDPAQPKALHGTILPLPATSMRAEKQDASKYLTEIFESQGSNLTLVAVGPLTNIALAVKLDRNFVTNVRRLVVMGGGHAVSNTTASAEFNFWADAEAASVVMNAGFSDITLIPLDATHKALVTYSDCDDLLAAGSAASVAAQGFIRRRIDVHEATERMLISGSAPVHDALCIGYLIDPMVVTLTSVHVNVERHGPLTVGRSVMDVLRIGGKEANCKVAFEADRRRFVDLMISTLT